MFNRMAEVYSCHCAAPTVRAEVYSCPCAVPTVRAEVYSCPRAVPTVRAEVYSCPCAVPTMREEVYSCPCAAPTLRAEVYICPRGVPTVRAEVYTCPCDSGAPQQACNIHWYFYVCTIERIFGDRHPQSYPQGGDILGANSNLLSSRHVSSRWKQLNFHEIDMKLLPVVYTYVLKPHL